MKEQRWKKAVASLARRMAVREANIGCALWSYQRRQPDAIKKSRGYAMTTGSAGGMSRPLWGIFRFRL